MEDDDDQSSLSSFISIGTAEIQPVQPVPPPSQSINPHEQPEPSALHAPVATSMTATNQTLADLIDMHRQPPIPSPPRSQYTLDTMQQLTENRSSSSADPNNRLSILDPSTIKVSFTGFLSDISTTLPLEEGLQKLYDLYQETSPTALPPLPLNLPITQLPLLNIANTLASHIQDLTTALTDCNANIDSLTHLNTRTKRDLNTLELQYCLARQEANMAHMSTDDLRLRLEWQKEEISRVNREKELAITKAGEVDSLKELIDALSGEVVEARKENSRLMGDIAGLEGIVGALRDEVEAGKGMLERTRFALRSVPGGVRWLCGKVLVPVSGRDADKDGDWGSEESAEDEIEGHREMEKERHETRDMYGDGDGDADTGGQQILTEKAEPEGQWLGQGLDHGQGQGQPLIQDEGQGQYQGQTQRRFGKEIWMGKKYRRERPLSRSFY